jgi:membrane-associated protease RseP (regulator of RpoE activity)
MKGTQKGTHWGTITLALSLVACVANQRGASAARDPEPTVDEQFQGQAASALPTELPPPSQPVGISGGGPQSRGGPAYLGVTFDPSFRNAAVVRDVHPGSPADQAGLQPGDVIEQLNGRTVRSNQDVLNDVARMRSGDVLDIGFSRRITSHTQVALDSRPAQNIQQPTATIERLPANAAQRVQTNRPSYDNNAGRQKQSSAAQNQRRPGAARQPDRDDRGLLFRGQRRR